VVLPNNVIQDYSGRFIQTQCYHVYTLNRNEAIRPASAETDILAKNRTKLPTVLIAVTSAALANNVPSA
jgi:hypothetical protein